MTKVLFTSRSDGISANCLKSTDAARGAGIEPYAAGINVPKSYMAEEGTPLNTSSFSAARPCCHLSIPTISLCCLSNYSMQYNIILDTMREKKLEIRTFATSSRSLFGGASTSKGVMVADATALAAYRRQKCIKSPINHTV